MILCTMSTMSFTVTILQSIYTTSTRKPQASSEHTECFWSRQRRERRRMRTRRTTLSYPAKPSRTGRTCTCHSNILIPQRPGPRD